MSFASINGTVLHYRLSGAQGGSPLILVNSLGTSGAIWDDMLPALERRHRVLVYDKRGHGLSGVPAGPYGIDDHVADLLGLAAHCGLTRFDLCGVSIGGMIAMRLAARHREAVRKLVLCDTAPKIGATQMWNDRIEQVRQGGMASIAEALVARWVSPEYVKARPTELAGWCNMLERCPAEGYVASCASVRDAQLEAEPGLIAVPTLVVVGENDVSTPPALVRELADGIAGAEYRTMADTGHVPSIEQPERLNQLIEEHLGETIHG